VVHVSIPSCPARSSQGHTLKERSGTGVGEFFFLLTSKWIMAVTTLKRFNPLHRGIFFLTNDIRGISRVASSWFQSPRVLRALRRGIPSKSVRVQVSGNFFSYAGATQILTVIAFGFNPLVSCVLSAGAYPQRTFGYRCRGIFFLTMSSSANRPSLVCRFNPLHTLKERSGTGVGEFFFLLWLFKRPESRMSALYHRFLPENRTHFPRENHSLNCNSITIK